LDKSKEALKNAGKEVKDKASRKIKNGFED
jgi:hypothetical protein